MNPQADVSQPAWSTRLIAELDIADERAKQLVAGLTPEQLNWRPQPGTWGVGQCLDHLCVTNEVYLPAISGSLRDKPVSPVENITLGWFARWFITSFIEPSPKTKRARAPKKIVPSVHVEPSVLDRFLRSNHAARELIRQAGNYDVNRIRFKNPLLRVLRFTVGTGLEIVSRHEQRHLLQAERAKQASGFPGP